jgi:hypothetical protein
LSVEEIEPNHADLEQSGGMLGIVARPLNRLVVTAHRILYPFLPPSPEISGSIDSLSVEATGGTTGGTAGDTTGRTTGGTTGGTTGNPTNGVPEPSTVLLSCLGLSCLGAASWRKWRARR